MLTKRRLSVLSLMFLVFLAAVGLAVRKQWQEMSATRNVEIILAQYHADDAADSEQRALVAKNPALKEWLTAEAATHRKQEMRHRWNANHPWIVDKDSFTTVGMGPGHMPDLGMLPPVAGSPPDGTLPLGAAIDLPALVNPPRIDRDRKAALPK